MTISNTPNSSYTVYHSAEGFQAGWVSPVGILENHQHGLLAAQRLQLSGQRFQRFLPPLLRGHFERRDSVRHSAVIAFRQRVPRPWRGRKTLRQHGVEFVELCLRSVVVRKSGSALHLADDRIKRAVGVLWRAEIAQPRVWFRSKTFQQCRRQSRFPYASLTGEQDHLAFASLCLRPAPQQQFEFFLPADQRG